MCIFKRQISLVFSSLMCYLMCNSVGNILEANLTGPAWNYDVVCCLLRYMHLQPGWYRQLPQFASLTLGVSFWSMSYNDSPSCATWLLLLSSLLKKALTARLGESDLHPISPKTSAPQDHNLWKERREKENSRRQKRNKKFRSLKKDWPCSWTCHTEKNRSIWLNNWVLQLSPEHIIYIRRVDSLNVTLSQVHPSFFLNYNNYAWIIYFEWKYTILSIYFDLTQIKKLYFDSSYFCSIFLCTVRPGSEGSNLTSDIFFFMEIYLIIFNSYHIVMTGYNIMLTIC